LLGDRFGRFGRGAVIHHIGTLVFGLRHGFDSRGAFSRRLSHFRRGARSGVFEAEKHEAGHDPDKNAELDRNKMCNFQIHFPKPLQAIIEMTEPKELFTHSCEIFSETVRYNNLKICEAQASCGRGLGDM